MASWGLHRIQEVRGKIRIRASIRWFAVPWIEFESLFRFVRGVKSRQLDFGSFVVTLKPVSLAVGSVTILEPSSESARFLEWTMAAAPEALPVAVAVPT